MQPRALKLRSYEFPANLAPEAKDFCLELVGDIEKTHAYYQQQIAFIKQQYKIALRAMRPDIVSAAALREMFDGTSSQRPTFQKDSILRYLNLTH